VLAQRLRREPAAVAQGGDGLDIHPALGLQACPRRAPAAWSLSMIHALDARRRSNVPTRPEIAARSPEPA